MFYANILTNRDKIIIDKDEEIRDLKDKLRKKFEKYEKMEQDEILESQYQKIQEFMYGSIKGSRINGISNKKVKIVQNIIDEMNKYKTIINELIEHNKYNKLGEIQAYLEKISLELPNLNM